MIRIVILALTLLSVTNDIAAQPILPWRYQINERLKQQDKLIAELLQRQTPLPGPIAAPPPLAPAPIYLLPIGGDPKQILPIEGLPKQPLPLEGAPKQELPPQGPPKQPLPIEGPPKMPPPALDRPHGYTIRALGPR